MIAAVFDSTKTLKNAAPVWPAPSPGAGPGSRTDLPAAASDTGSAPVTVSGAASRRPG